ncbi:hypothetical protein K3757_05365 [Sulfitobacter sp. S223]|uniref:hypothetical protein n=1 Tax=Sulfitobacter sp. S223 TaxID=2867023 RepID=UPI0021A61E32|nr:hypothetical protein [Sulfitobacter sp. S223]UWR27370.1 hypothetical protein K3757_05365 [Sulfitobacter sp. S223]
MAVMTIRSDDVPPGETDVISVQSLDGRSLEFSYERFRQIGGLTLNERMGKVDFPKNVIASLSSDAMEQRPIAVRRLMRLPTDELSN